jgi:5'-methylthioinosine phosphorylase
MLGIIGGSGLSRLSNLSVTEQRTIATPYGDPSAPVAIGTVAGRNVAFLPRHGPDHPIPPHLVNYRANVKALQMVGVRRIAAVFAVGGISDDLGPGRIAVPDQIIDYTSGREHTYSDGTTGTVLHIDFTRPYTESLRAALIAAAASAGIDVVAGGTYAVVNGPRLETAAEIDRIERDGATMVGMTGMPEAALARELGLHYAAVALSVNHAAGRGGSAQAVSLDEIHAILDRSMQTVRVLLEQWVDQMAKESTGT